MHTVNECLAPTSRPTSAVGSSKSKLSASERQWAEYYRLMEQSQLENITVRPVPKPPAPRPRTALEREAKHGRCRLQPSHKRFTVQIERAVNRGLGTVKVNLLSAA